MRANGNGVGTRARVAALGLLALLVGCAGGGSPGTGSASGYPPPTECPQPRFTGKAPEPIRTRENPLPATNTHIAAGGALYQGDVQPACRMCHGRDGDGRGPLSAQFEPRPRNFACKETVNGIPDGQLYWIIRNGSPGTAMPGFGDKLSERETWQVVLYLRRLAQ